MKILQLNTVFSLLVAVFYVCHIEACDKYVGPAGTVHCIRISRYSDYQWSVCRTDKYIKTKSNGNHHCEDRSSVYCYYQCMLDVHDKNNGKVYSDCACSPSDPTPTEAVKLPPWCYSPDGTMCNWYRECLNKAYSSCEGSKDDYAIGFADKFCNLYKKNYKKFSNQGKQWVDAVRKCLQLKLVPLIDISHQKTCAELKSIAFETHTPCYLNPDESSQSFCDLSYKDRWTVFVTIKSAFFGAFGSSLKGMYDMMAGCTRAAVEKKVKEVKEKIESVADYAIDYAIDKIEKIIDKLLRKTAEQIKIWIKEMLDVQPIQFDLSVEIDDIFKLFKRKRRSIKNDEETERSQLAGKIVDALALKQEWKNRSISWFAYANNETTNENNTMSIRFLVADRFKYEGVDNDTLFLTQPANLTEVALQLSHDVLNGRIQLQVDGKDVNIMKLNGCLDWDCNVLAFNITSTPAPSTPAPSTPPPSTPPPSTSPPSTPPPSNSNNAVGNNAVSLHQAMHTLVFFIIFVTSSIFIP